MPSKDSCPIWAMIDLQGDLETRKPVPLQGKFIGDLHFTKQDQPILIIGHHILYGKVVQLEKPFVILTKEQQQNENEERTSEAMEVDNTCNSVSYTIKAIIKTKLLFKTRPKPIIAHVPKKL